jgi:type II secretory pathway predicted ATPase ExeA
LYEAHFGLNGRPFGETVDASAYVALPSRETVARRIRYGLEHGQGPALMYGPAGAGKTLLASALISASGVPSAHLTFPAMPTAELIAYVAEEFGATTEGGASGGKLGGSLRSLRRWLSSTAARGVRPMLVVDEAQLIEDPATFDALRGLLNFASTGPPDLSLLLVGGPEVLLRLPAGLSDRLTARCLLGPLTEAESASYVLGRLAAVGAREPIFSAESLASLHRAAEGLPRRLNRLADLALLVAYAEGLPRPDARAVVAATREADPDTFAA